MRAGNPTMAGVLALAAGLSLAGCSSGPAKVLSDSVYAKSVPVYKGAQFTESMGNESWGDEPGSYTHGETWWFKTKASKQELLDYYQKLYPEAEKLELDTGDVQLRWRPEGAERFEDVTVVVGDHELRIGESVRPETRARLRGEPVGSSSSGGGGTSSESPESSESSDSDS
jgi:hypothetical protein